MKIEKEALQMMGKDPLSPFGGADKYSPGLATMMADRQLKRAMADGTTAIPSLRLPAP